MKNEYLISDFVTLTKQKNGRVKSECSTVQQSNIYKWLKAQGYGKITVDGKILFFQRKGEVIEPTSVITMKHNFLSYLEKASFQKWPANITRKDLLEWYYETLPLKQNALFRQHLFEVLSEEELHRYKMADDHNYRHRFNINQLLNQFDNWGFKKTLDVKGSFCKDNLLYYKPVANGIYLVFNHYNADSKNATDGFDCWLAPFKKESEIGNIKNPDVRDIRLSFQLDRDYDLIAPYLTN